MKKGLIILTACTVCAYVFGQLFLSSPQDEIIGVKISQSKVKGSNQKPLVIQSIDTSLKAFQNLHPVRFKNIKKTNIAQTLDLDFSNTKANDNDISHVRQAKSLRKLYLTETQVTDNGLTYLTDLKHLSHISLVRTQITDAGLDVLVSIKSLKSVDLFGTQVSKEGLKKFKEKRSDIRVR